MPVLALFRSGLRACFVCPGVVYLVLFLILVDGFSPGVLEGYCIYRSNIYFCDDLAFGFLEGQSRT